MQSQKSHPLVYLLDDLYNVPRMNLFESFNSMNRTREERLLEHSTPRKLFVTLLVLMFLLGGNAEIAMYHALHHRFDSAEITVLPLLIIILGPMIRVIYRRLGR